METATVVMTRTLARLCRYATTASTAAAPVLLGLLLTLGAVSARGAVSLGWVDGAEPVDPRLADNLRSHLRLAAEPCDAPAWRIRSLFREIEADLTPAFQALGYYRASLETRLDQSTPCWQADILVQPGPRVTVRQRAIEITGPLATDTAFADLLNSLPLSLGDPLDHGRYEQIKTRLGNLALERGYFDFQLTSKALRIFPEAQAVDIMLAGSSGPRYHFGAVEVDDSPLDEEFLRRLIGVNPGEPYDARRVVAANRYLNDAGYFSAVSVRAAVEDRDAQAVPIDVELQVAPRHAWRVGAGFATDTGPRGSVHYENRRVNSRGHHLDSELRLSPVESGLTGDYVIPGRDPNHERYSVALGVLQRDTDTSNSDSTKLVVRHTVDGPRWSITRFAELLSEQSTIGSTVADANLVMPGLSVTRAVADDVLRTREGFRINLEVRGAHRGLLSDATFLQLRGHTKLIHRFGDGPRLVGRLEVGTTLGDEVSALPASVRFFAGGDDSVRGYNLEALGPKDANGDVIGGRHLLAAGLDIEYPVLGEDWWVAAFADAGNAFDDNQFSLRHGYGVGVRWYSPIGRLRVDIAVPDDRSEDPWRLHIGLGVDL